MRIAVLAITAGGNRLAATLARELPEADHLVGTAGEKIAERLSEAWGRYDGLVCVMAAGIVVRLLAPLLGAK